MTITTVPPKKKTQHKPNFLGGGGVGDHLRFGSVLVYQMLVGVPELLRIDHRPGKNLVPSIWEAG